MVTEKSELIGYFVKLGFRLEEAESVAGRWTRGPSTPQQEREGIMWERDYRRGSDGRWHLTITGRKK